MDAEASSCSTVAINRYDGAPYYPPGMKPIIRIRMEWETERFRRIGDAYGGKGSNAALGRLVFSWIAACLNPNGQAAGTLDEIMQFHPGVKPERILQWIHLIADLGIWHVTHAGRRFTFTVTDWSSACYLIDETCPQPEGAVA